MKKIKRFLAAMLVCMMMAALAGCSMEGVGDGSSTDEGADDSDGKKVIGVSLMTMQYEFFQDLKAGIEEAAGGDYEIVFNDPNMDMQAQIDAIENFCAQKVDAIILTCVDGDGIIPALDTCEEAGIPVVTVDYQPSGGTYETYIGSDNFLGGQLAAKWAMQHILQDVEDPHMVFLYNPMSIASVQRIDGFKDILEKERPDAEIVAEQGGDSREAFMGIMEDVLMANDRVDMVFSYSADGGLGSYDAIQALGREGEVSVMGFDASAEEQSVINEGGCYRGSIIQFPDKLGAACVDSVTKVLNGEELEKEIAVEVGVYTADGIVYAADLE